MTGTEEHGAGRELWWQALAVLTNLTVLTALLVYFGWKRAEIRAEYFGVDEGVFEFSTRDYLLRSPETVALVMGAIAVLGLGWAWTDRRLRPHTSGWLRSVRGRRLLTVLALCWLLLPAIAVLLSTPFAKAQSVVFPLAIGAGFLLSLYAVHLRALASQAPPEPGWRKSVVAGFTSVIVVLSLFAAASGLTDLLRPGVESGLTRAIAASPYVAVYSIDRLHLSGSTEKQLPPENSRYRYRYIGLRLADYTGGKFFLVPENWSGARSGVVVILPEDHHTVRLEFRGLDGER